MRAKIHSVPVGKRSKPAQPVVPAPKSKLAAVPMICTMPPLIPTTLPRFKIEKGVPIPSVTRYGGGRQRLYPLDLLEPGESFFVPGPRKSITGAASYWGKVSKRTFITRPYTEGGVQGTRVWRMK